MDKTALRINLSKHSLLALGAVALLWTASPAMARSEAESACVASVWQNNIDNAIRACRRAAIEGSVKGQHELAKMYFGDGDKTLVDIDEAIHWFTQAAKKKDRASQIMLYNIYDQGLGGIKQNDKKALQWLQTAADNGHFESQLLIGQRHLIGDGLSLDFKKASNYIHSAAKGGVVDAMYVYGTLLEYGIGVKQDSAKAAAFYHQASSKKHAEAQFALARMYQHGQGVQMNPREGAEWIKRAADQGSPSAQYRLALMHEQGLGVAKDPDKAKELLEMAREAEYPAAIIAEARRLEAEDEDSEEAFELYKLASEKDYGPGLVAMGYYHLFGKHVEHNYKMAADYFIRASEIHYGPGYSALGRCHKEGKGVEKSLKLAAENYLKAAKLGVGDAQLAVGEMYAKGTVFKKDLINGYAWLKLADRNKSGNAGFILAMTKAEMNIDQRLEGETQAENLAALYGTITPNSV